MKHTLENSIQNLEEAYADFLSYDEENECTIEEYVKDMIDNSDSDQWGETKEEGEIRIQELKDWFNIK